MKIRILDIIKGTTVDGPGFRTSIYFAGCVHQCPGCHNPQSWDFSAGMEMEIEEILKIVREEDFDVTLSGGDPLCSPVELFELTKAIKILGYNIWVYTGYTYEEIKDNKILKDSLQYVDTIVDGRFIESLKNPDLQFRGSANQRIIDL